jgi:hypothetical protein
MSTEQKQTTTVPSAGSRGLCIQLSFGWQNGADSMTLCKCWVYVKPYSRNGERIDGGWRRISLSATAYARMVAGLTEGLKEIT